MKLMDMDRAGLVFARTHAHNPGLDRLAVAYSRVGEHAAGWLVLGAAGAVVSPDAERRRAWLRGVGIVAASYGVNQAIKFAIRRRRPNVDGLPPLSPVVTQLSFPSAHATTSFAAARAYRHLAPAWALYLAAGALAVGRPYLGVHYPSDVLAGAAIGTAVADLWPGNGLTGGSSWSGVTRRCGGRPFPCPPPPELRAPLSQPPATSHSGSASRHRAHPVRRGV